MPQGLRRVCVSVVSFGGDAIFSLFPEEAQGGDALQVAKDIETFMKEWGQVESSFGSFQLGVSQAVHFGPFVGLHLGSPQEAHFLVTGPSVRTVARLEKRTKRGRIGISSTVKQEEPPSMKGKRKSPLQPLDLTPYLPPGLGETLDSLEDAYRPLVVVFFETKGHGQRFLQEFFTRLTASLRLNQGILLKTDLSVAGNKWLCVFGLTRVRDSDTHQALRCAWDVLTHVSDPNRVRVGIHTGITACLKMGSEAFQCVDIMGGTVNLSARILKEAPWGEMWGSQTLAKNVKAWEKEDQGLFNLKGLDHPQALYRFSAIRKKSSVPLVQSPPLIGRKGELKIISKALDRAKKGRGKAFDIRGEAGIGKTRLAEASVEIAKKKGFRALLGRTRAVAGGSHRVIRGLIRDALELPWEASEPDLKLALDRKVTTLRLSQRVHRQLAILMGLSIEKTLSTRPEAVRLMNRLAVLRFFEAMVEKTPLIVTLEDLHWCDPASLDIIKAFIPWCQDKKMVLLFLRRPEGPFMTGVETLDLGSMKKEETAQLLAKVLGVSPVEKVVEKVWERSEGNPFYTEEMGRYLRDNNFLQILEGVGRFSRPPGPEDLPLGIEALIASRLDTLERDVRRVVSVGSVAGRQFLRRILEAFSEFQPFLEPALQEMVHREVVVLNRPQPEEEYAFKHALTRDVAYGSILHSKRRTLHRTLARILEEVWKEERQAHLGVLAYHYEEGNESREASECYLEAAREAADRYALEESHKLYEGYWRNHKEWDEESLGALFHWGRYVLPFVENNKRARAEITKGCQKAKALRLPRLEVEGLRCLGLLDFREGNLKRAKTRLQKVVARSRTLGDLEILTKALGQLAAVLDDIGEYDEGNKIHQQAIEMARSQGDRNREAIALGNFGAHLFDRGKDVQARKIFEKTLAMHAQDPDPLSEAYVLNNFAMLHYGEGRLKESAQMLEKALKIVHEIGDIQFEGQLSMNYGVLMVQRGHLEDAKEEFIKALHCVRVTGNRKWEGLVCCKLGEVTCKQGKWKESESWSQKSLFLAQETGDRPGEVLAHSELGWVKVKTRRLKEAIKDYQQACAIAKAIQNTPNQVRALGHLARAYRLDGDDKKAARSLSEAKRLISSEARSALTLFLMMEEGHQQLAKGRSADSLLKEGSVLLSQLEMEVGSQSQNELEELGNAERAFQAHKPLIRGECPENL